MMSCQISSIRRFRDEILAPYILGVEFINEYILVNFSFFSDFRNFFEILGHLDPF